MNWFAISLFLFLLEKAPAEKPFEFEIKMPFPPKEAENMV